MDLNAYLLDSVFQATTPRGETAEAAQTRRQAVQAMFAAHAPTDSMQAMIACNSVALQFLLIAATKDAFDAEPDPALQTKRRAAILAIGRALTQCHRQLDRCRAPAKRPRAKPVPGPRPPAPIQEATPPPPVPTPPREPAALPRPNPQWPGQPKTTLTAGNALLAAMTGRAMHHATG